MSKNFNFVHLIFVIRKKLTPMLKIAEVVVVFSGNLTNNFTGRPGLFPMTPPNQIHHDFDIGKSKTNEFIRRHSEISDADQHPDIRRHGCDDIVTEMFPKPEIPRQHSDDVVDYSGGESYDTYYQPKFRPSLRCLLRVK